MFPAPNVSLFSASSFLVKHETVTQPFGRMNLVGGEPPFRRGTQKINDTLPISPT
jgi:hypothetical protein